MKEKAEKLIGTGTALVTPFLPSGKIDEETLRDLVRRQIIFGIDFLVSCGTTGESPTLSHEEQHRILKIVLSEARDSFTDSVPVVAGTGSNSTEEAIDLTEHAKDAGADGCLVVAPYYNKPTQAGLIDYFTKVADVGLPVIVYNIPGRTAVNVTPETLKILADHPNIVGVKEATGNLEQVTQNIVNCGEKFIYLGGDDTLTLPIMSVGGHGVISVLSNIMPHEVSAMTHQALKGNWKEAREMFLRLFPLAKALFMETNPIPVKAVMAQKNLIKPVWRSPLVPPSAETEQKLAELFAEIEI
ncbi:4-hydroxy-tetrahydrodipicolinate synthase [bacterium]|nr:4-hydroxy-tetrahydrodipicolinate synthase [bacterium]